SSGRQGYALARTAAARGADVTLVAANVSLPDPAGVRLVRVGSAVELAEAMEAERGGADALVMTAAVADFRPVTSAASKIKKSGAAPAPIELVENPDILAGLVESRKKERSGQTIVGFAAETDDVIDNGRAKLTRKGCDLLVVNEVGAGKAFGTDDNKATVLGADGTVVDIPTGPKEDLADRVWDLVVARLPDRAS
ncbi:MAG: phosphopantothenoylcysteine decarboxylase, partial [Nocardiopsis sp. BM-2018]